MASVAIDASLCTGCGLCASVCPDGFEMGEDNLAKVTTSGIDKCDVNDVASQCPVEAIKIN